MGRELLIGWLNDAYAMERAQIGMLERFINEFKDHTEIRSELKQHLVETREQIDDIKDCIERLGGTVVEATKSTLDTMVAAVRDLQANQYHDEYVKNLVIVHAAEHYEHIFYMAIAEAAHHLGEDEIADICERISEEEKAMAEWVEELIPNVVTSCLTTMEEE